MKFVVLFSLMNKRSIKLMKKRKKKSLKKERYSTEMSSKDEELYDNSCEDKNAKMAMLAKIYKKLAF